MIQDKKKKFRGIDMKPKSSLDDEPTSVLSVCHVCKIFSSRSDTYFALPCCRIVADVDVNYTSRYIPCHKAHRWKAAVVAVVAAVAMVVSCSDRAQDTDNSMRHCSSFLSATNRPLSHFDNRSNWSIRSSIEHLSK